MNLRNLSIKRKLTLMAMLTSGIALVLSSASFLTYDLISFRHLLSQDLMTQAEIIGYNSAAAMAFKDESAATVTLSALMAKEDVVASQSALVALQVILEQLVDQLGDAITPRALGQDVRALLEHGCVLLRRQRVDLHARPQ